MLVTAPHQRLSFTQERANGSVAAMSENDQKCNVAVGQAVIRNRSPFMPLLNGATAALDARFQGPHSPNTLADVRQASAFCTPNYFGMSASSLFMDVERHILSESGTFARRSPPPIAKSSLCWVVTTVTAPPARSQRGLSAASQI